MNQTITFKSAKYGNGRSVSGTVIKHDEVRATVALNNNRSIKTFKKSDFITYSIKDWNNGERIIEDKG